jgi:uncharacterized membrane protein
MWKFLVAYGTTFIVFLVIDAIWLSQAGQVLYRAALGDLLLERFRPLPAVAFYLIYILGVVGLAVWPGLREESLIVALASGALFGFCAYATYDLTNLATLRNWSLTVTLVDLAWGTLSTTVAAAAGYIAARYVDGRGG